MTSSWKTGSLGDVLELQRGHDLPSSQRTDGDIPVIGSFGVTGTHNVAAYDGPGVAIGRSGASIGKATYVEGPFWPLNTALFVVDFKGNDPGWIYRLLESLDFNAYNSGSAQPSLNRNFIRGIRVRVPPVREQWAIAEVLGALDDKIAADRHQIRLLLDLADSLYKRSATSEDGTQVTFGEVAEIGGGGTPRTSADEYWGGSTWWATPTDVTGLSAPYLYRTSRTITQEGLAACSSSLYPAGSILMTSRATIGAFALSQVPTAVNQGFIVVNAKESRYQSWLFHEMRSRVQEFLTFANGATFLELPRGRFKSLPVRVPHLDAAKRFDDAVRPLHELAATLLLECERLEGTRDELLPLLMSGKVRVREAEKVVEGVA